MDREVYYLKYGNTYFYPNLRNGIGIGEPGRLPLGTPVQIAWGSGRTNKPLVTALYQGHRYYAYVDKTALRKKNPIHPRSR